MSLEQSFQLLRENLKDAPLSTILKVRLMIDAEVFRRAGWIFIAAAVVVLALILYWRK